MDVFLDEADGLDDLVKSNFSLMLVKDIAEYLHKSMGLTWYHPLYILGDTSHTGVNICTKDDPPVHIATIFLDMVFWKGKIIVRRPGIGGTERGHIKIDISDPDYLNKISEYLNKILE